MLIRSTRGGAVAVNGYREDLIIGDVIVTTLTSYVNVTTCQWRLLGRPEGSVAGGIGPEPIELGTGASATFIVDSDAGYRKDGSYLVECLVNAGTPSEYRIRAILARLSGITVAGGRTLRVPSYLEGNEDTDIASENAGYAKSLNRWFRRISEIVGVGNQRDNNGYRLGNGTVGIFTGPTPDLVYMLGIAAGTNITVSHFSGYSKPVSYADQLVAIPFVIEVAGTIKTLLQKTGSHAGASMVFGIYSSLVDTSFPDALLASTGAIDCSVAGVKSVDINLPITPGLYWIVSNINAAFAANVDAYLLNIAWTYPSLGWSLASPLTHGWGGAWTHALAYGALPATFPQAFPSVIEMGIAGAAGMMTAWMRWVE